MQLSTGNPSVPSSRYPGEVAGHDARPSRRKTSTYVGGADRGPLGLSAPGADSFGAYVGSLSGRGEMPATLDEELHPTRVMIRAKQAAVT